MARLEMQWGALSPSLATEKRRGVDSDGCCVAIHRSKRVCRSRTSRNVVEEPDAQRPDGHGVHIEVAHAGLTKVSHTNAQMYKLSAKQKKTPPHTHTHHYHHHSHGCTTFSTRSRQRVKETNAREARPDAKHQTTTLYTMLKGVRTHGILCTSRCQASNPYPVYYAQRCTHARNIVHVQMPSIKPPPCMLCSKVYARTEYCAPSEKRVEAMHKATADAVFFSPSHALDNRRRERFSL
jgi:hypothetical protein